MISIIRKILDSKAVMALFALIILAFMITGWGSGSGGLGNLALGGDSIAKVGSMGISNADASKRILAEFDIARQQQPGLTMAAFDAQGGIDGSLDRMINSRTILAFAAKHGLVVSERLIDSKILGTPSFYGPAGKFDRNVYLGALGQRNMSEEDHREDVRAQILADMIIPAAAGASRAPKGLLAPYASLILEKRFGQIASIPVSKFSGAAASEAEIKSFYDRNIARYTVPETRIVRYALFDKSRFEGKVSATDAEIEAVYKADIAKYQPAERRVLTQVIASSEAAAKTMVAQVRSGTSLEDAAKTAKLDTTTLDQQDKATFGSLASKEAANLAFATKQGSVTDAVKSGLGWHVIRVDKIITSGGKSLAEARSAIAAELNPRKVQEALADMVVRIEEAIDGGATFEEVATKEGLSVTTTPAVTESGIAPGNPEFKAGESLPLVLKDAFQSEVDDDPTVVTIKANDQNALVKVDKITPATPKALSAIHDQVASEAQADKASRAARKAAMDMVAKVNGGQGFAQAVTAAGLGSARPLSAQRLQIAQAQGKAPAELTTLFALAQRKAKMVETGGGNYSVIWLERLEPGNASERPDLLAATEGELGKALGDEYAQQLLNAMKADLGLQRNEANILALKKALRSGQTRQ